MAGLSDMKTLVKSLSSKLNNTSNTVSLSNTSTIEERNAFRNLAEARNFQINESKYNITKKRKSSQRKFKQTRGRSR